MFKETPSLFEKILFRDEFDIFLKKGGKLYIKKVKEELQLK